MTGTATVLYRLASECKVSSHLLQNNVTFVTFNYDVSLENHLYKGLSSIDLFEQDKPRINKFLGEHRVLHVYGQVRQNPFEDNQYGTLGRGQPYHSGEAEIIGRLTPEGYASQNDHYKDYPAIYSLYYKEAFEQAYVASKSIQTIGSTKDHQGEIIELAKEAIRKADCVYILGYGFDKQNSERLDLRETLAKKITGTTPPVSFTNFEDNNLVNKRASRLFFGDDSEFSSGGRKVVGDLHKGASYYEKSIRAVYDAFERDFESIEDQVTYRTAILRT